MNISACSTPNRCLYHSQLAVSLPTFHSSASPLPVALPSGRCTPPPRSTPSPSIGSLRAHDGMVAVDSHGRHELIARRPCRPRQELGRQGPISCARRCCPRRRHVLPPFEYVRRPGGPPFAPGGTDDRCAAGAERDGGRRAGTC